MKGLRPLTPPREHVPLEPHFIFLAIARAQQPKKSKRESRGARPFGGVKGRSPLQDNTKLIQPLQKESPSTMEIFGRQTLSFLSLQALF